MFGLTESEKIFALLLSLVGGAPDTSTFAGLSSGGHASDYPVTVQSCPRPLGRHEIEGKTIVCGSVSVPENHDATDGRRIDIVFTILKSHSTYAEPDPVVHLHGGPGAGLLGGLEAFAAIFDQWRTNRDIVMFDQRAAGLSARSTDCYEAMTANIVQIVGAAKPPSDDGGDGDKPDAFTQCITEMREAGVGLEFYNTEQNARDVAAIVKTLGYNAFNLYGISYGTKLSLEVMRQKPEGLRAVVLDGVAPPSVRLYDTLALPQNEAMVTLVGECKADEACNKAYPDLAAKIDEAFEKAAAGKVVYKGEALPPHTPGFLISNRNGNYEYASYTRYLPAAIYEIANGGKTPTFDKIMATLKVVKKKPHFTFARTGAEDLRQAAKSARLNDEQKRILEITLANTDLFKDGSHAMDLSIDEFKNALRRHRELGPLAELFDAEMSKASSSLVADRGLATALFEDLAALQNAEPSKSVLRTLVTRHYQDGSRDRLLALIEAMSDNEVETAFASVRRSIGRIEAEFAGNAHLMIYACQEDLPHNSLKGYAELTKTLDFPQIGPTQWDKSAAGFFKTCEGFEPRPRAGFHDPVVSDIPTLSLGSTWDTQTAASWAKLAAETLSNGQAFIIPEAGHGAIAYQECAIDMGVAFINNPYRKLDNRCAESARPEFYIAPWAKG